MHGESQIDSNINSSVHTSDESLLLLKEKMESKFEEQRHQITEQQSRITVQQSQIEKILKNNEEFEKTLDQISINVNIGSKFDNRD